MIIEKCRWVFFIVLDVEFQLEFNRRLDVSAVSPRERKFIPINRRFQGQLNKYTNAFKGYQTRYFVLDTQTKNLFYFMVGLVQQSELLIMI